MRTYPALAAALTLGLSLGFATSAPAQTTEATTEQALNFTLDTPIETLYANPRGKAVMDKIFPDMKRHPSYPQFKALSLNKLANAAGGAITSAQLKKAATELKKLDE